MCGRFVSASSPDDLVDYFDARGPAVELESDFNVAPTKSVYVVRAADRHRDIGAMRWGLVPYWAKDLKIGSRLINARSETVIDKPAFRSAFARRRCLVPADGFYEWARKSDTRTKQPYFIHRHDGERLVMAGLWERWWPPGDDGQGRDKSQEPIETFTILTTGPNREMAAIHDRMPVLVPPGRWDDWLHPDTEVATLEPMLVPAPDDFLELRPVSTRVNSVANNGQELVEAVEIAS